MLEWWPVHSGASSVTENHQDDVASVPPKDLDRFAREIREDMGVNWEGSSLHGKGDIKRWERRASIGLSEQTKAVRIAVEETVNPSIKILGLR